MRRWPNGQRKVNLRSSYHFGWKEAVSWIAIIAFIIFSGGGLIGDRFY